MFSRNQSQVLQIFGVHLLGSTKVPKNECIPLHKTHRNASDGLITKIRPCNIQRFLSCKKQNENFLKKIYDFLFLIFCSNIDCVYTLEPPQRVGSNEYPQSLFWSKNKKNRYTPAYPSFSKVGYKGVFISRTCFPDGLIIVRVYSEAKVVIQTEATHINCD